MTTVFAKEESKPLKIFSQIKEPVTFRAKIPSQVAMPHGPGSYSLYPTAFLQTSADALMQPKQVDARGLAMSFWN